MADSPWPQILPSTLTDQVYSAVRDRILAGDIAPGQFAREQELSTAMNVSRTPLREALTRLASEGLLERLPHRGFRVPKQSYRQLVELYPIVSALEVLAGTLAFPEMEGVAIDQLQEANEQMREALEEKDVATEVELNNRFHHLISELSGNDRLCELLDDLRGQVRPLEMWYYSYPEHTGRSILEHGAVIESLRIGDFDKAVEILRGNMSLTKMALFEETALGKVDSTESEGALLE